jgi:chemotaxis protein CheY-P-specific phosphatase CheC
MENTTKTQVVLDDSSRDFHKTIEGSTVLAAVEDTEGKGVQVIVFGSFSNKTLAQSMYHLLTSIWEMHPEVISLIGEALMSKKLDGLEIITRLLGAM